jgi:type I restriction enzyme S subunit
VKKGWSEVALGEVAAHRSVFFDIDDLAEYKRCRVRLHAQGIELRDRIPGALIKTKAQQRCRPCDFLVAEIDAKVGGYGIVPDSLDGAIVSSHYFLFEADRSVLDPRFLGYFSRTRYFAEQVKARGSTNYAAIRPSHVLGYTIRLPTIAQQQRVVTHLDAIETRLDRARKLREEQELEFKATLSSAFRKLVANAEWVAMGEVAPLYRRPTEITLDGEYPELGARSFGKGIFHKPTLRGESLTWQKLFQVHAGDIVISNIKAWEGAISVAGEADHGRFGSHRYLTCKVDPKRALPEFVCFYLLSASGLEQVGLASPGSADRNRTLAVGRLNKIKVPIVPLATQAEFQKLLNLRIKVRTEAAQASQRISALLPSLLDRIFNS